MQHNFEAKLFNFGGKIPHFLGKLQKFSPLRARNFEKVHCKGMIFQGNSLHCNGLILEAKFWAERSFSDRVPPVH